MAKRKETPKQDLNPDEVNKLLQRIDLDKPGAKEALDALRENPSATIEEYQQLVEDYPIEFAPRFKPVPQQKFSQGLEVLKRLREGDKAAVLAIRSGAEVNYESPGRLTWGNANLDWVSGGGIPRARVSQIKGADGFGKTFVCLKAAAHTLAAGGSVMWVAVEPFDAKWARICGVPVHYPQEMADKDPTLAEYNANNVAGERFVMVVGRTGNEVLQTVVDAVALNIFDLVVIDSITPLISANHLERKEVGDSTPGGEAMMVGQFCSFTQTAWNSVEAKAHRITSKVYLCQSCNQTFPKKKDHTSCPSLQKGSPKFLETGEVGEPPRTAVLVVSQMRSQGIGASVPIPDDAPSGKGLKHAKSLDLELKGRIRLKANMGSYEEVFGSVVQVVGAKSKVGTADRIAVIEFWTKTMEGYSEAGRYNPMTDLVGTRVTKGKEEVTFEGIAERAGLIRGSGGWYTIGEYRFQGKAALQKYLVENPQVHQALNEAVFEWIGKGG